MLKPKLTVNYTKLQKYFERQSIAIETGIFNNKLAKKPNYSVKKPFLSSSVNSLGKVSNIKQSTLLEILNTKYNILSKIFVNFKQNVVLLKLIPNYFVNKQANFNKLQNLVTALVTLPITKKQYGKNTTSTVKQKGFDWKFINTGQTVKNIKTKATRYD